MRASLDFASPVTNRIADTLEMPLKYIDNAVCVGLDFVEEKMPSVKLPPDEIYENMRNSIRWWSNHQSPSDKAIRNLVETVIFCSIEWHIVYLIFLMLMYIFSYVQRLSCRNYVQNALKLYPFKYMFGFTNYFSVINREICVQRDLMHWF